MHWLCLKYNSLSPMILTAFWEGIIQTEREHTNVIQKGLDPPEHLLALSEAASCAAKYESAHWMVVYIIEYMMLTRWSGNLFC